MTVMEDIKPKKKDSNLIAALAYIGTFGLGIFAPVLIYILIKDDRYVRFHALHSIFFMAFLLCFNLVSFPLLFVMTFIINSPMLFLIFFPLIFAINILPLFYFAYKAYKGRNFSSLPILMSLTLKYL